MKKFTLWIQFILLALSSLGCLFYALAFIFHFQILEALGLFVLSVGLFFGLASTAHNMLLHDYKVHWDKVNNEKDEYRARWEEEMKRRGITDEDEYRENWNQSRNQ